MRWRRRTEADFGEEVKAHIALETDRLIAEGMPPAEARGEAHRRFGNELSAIERYHYARRAPWRDALVQDVRYAWRQLRRSPAFAATIVVTLALGIGANAIIFGVVDRLLLSAPDGVRQPERVRRIHFRERAPSWMKGADSITLRPTAFPVVTALQRVPAFEAVAGETPFNVTLDQGSDADHVEAFAVTGNYFPLLGVRPALGRFFSPDEARIPAGEPVVVLSYGLWQRRYAGSPAVLGRTVRLDAKPYTIVGVAPRGFTGLDLTRVELWVPVSAIGPEGYGQDWATSNQSIWIRAVARLAPGVTPEQAAEQGTMAIRTLVQDWPKQWQEKGSRVIAASIIAARGPTSMPSGPSGGGPPVARVSLWLVGVSTLLLLIACANVANLLLARGVRRRREIAVRLALGVGRGRLIRQLLTETALLTILAAAVAVPVTLGGAQLVRTRLLPDVMWGGSAVNGRVLLFTAIATAVTVLLAGMAPAMQGSVARLADALRLGVREGGGRRSHLQRGLLVAQAGLSVLLLVGAALFVRSLAQVRRVDAGVDLRHTLMVSMSPGSVGLSPERGAALFHEAAAAASQVPGVSAVALVAGSTPTRIAQGATLGIPGRDSIGRMPNGGPFFSVIGSRYFAVTGARLVRGRAFTDAEERIPSRVAVVNESLARALWPDGDALGACVIVNTDPSCSTVVGVVQDVMAFNLLDAGWEEIYLPLSHPAASPLRFRAVMARTAGEATATAGRVRAAVQGLAPDMPYVSVQSFEERVAGDLRPWRLGASLFTAFGALALLIAAVGLYSVLAYAVSQRRGEIGIRMALGAARRDVLRLIVGDGVRVVALGLLLGAAAALLAGRFVQPLLYETSARDPRIYGAVAVVLLAVALAASLLPAWRAARTDPSVALRAE